MAQSGYEVVTMVDLPLERSATHCGRHARILGQLEYLLAERSRTVLHVAGEVDMEKQEVQLAHHHDVRRAVLEGPLENVLGGHRF